MDEWMNRIEAKLDKLNDAKYLTDPDQIKRLLVAFKAGRRIESIKEIRAMTGFGLKEAMNLLEGCK
jgi:ribosomal protein L7/L12